jgi:hypothetical protein
MSSDVKILCRIIFSLLALLCIALIVRGAVAPRQAGVARFRLACDRFAIPLNNRRDQDRCDCLRCCRNPAGSQKGSRKATVGSADLKGYFNSNLGGTLGAPALVPKQGLRQFGNNLATTLAVSAQRGCNVTGRRAAT